MKYKIKEIFFSLQGEGLHSGRAAVFCRFAGCNLWNGKEVSRIKSKCSFCDTDFLGVDGQNGGIYTASTLTNIVSNLWHSKHTNSTQKPYVIFTGGEPLLQLNVELVLMLKKEGFETAIETNGTLTVPKEIDWITVSPKDKAEIIQTSGNELKLVFPQEKDPKEYSKLNFNYFFLLPMTTDSISTNKRNLNLAASYCLSNPQWRLTGQYHKLWKLP